MCPRHITPSLEQCAWIPQDIIRACVKIRLLTGQYRLKVDIAKQSGGPPTCQLCHKYNDDFFSFAAGLDCKTLCSQRSDFQGKVKPILSGHEQCNATFTSRILMLQVIMDCTRPILLIPMELHYQLELIGRALEITIYLPKKRIKPSQFWHIFTIKVSRNCIYLRGTSYSSQSL